MFFPSVFWIGRFVVFLTYPCLLLVFGLWLYSLYNVHRKELNLLHFLPRKRSAWLIISAITILFLLYEPFEFKFVYDELLISTSAELMHHSRLTGMPQWANDYSGSYVFLQTILDKRPLFFPFLLSLVHDFTGYRYENVFLLNAILTFFMLVLIYSVSKIFTNHRGGILAVLLAGTLPLFSVLATSGHFEILNIVMLLMTIALSYYYMEKPNDRRLIPLVYCLVLFSQVRYENSIYLLPFGILILLGWRKAGRPILPWRVIITPLFLIVSTLHYRMILLQNQSYFQAGPNGRDLTFSLSYAYENLASACRFLLSVGFGHANSYLLSIFGFTSLALFVIYLWKRAPSRMGQEAKITVMTAFLISIILLSLVLTFFNFGLFDNFITSRLSLPLHLLFIILIPFIAARFRGKFPLSAVIGGLLISFFTAMLLPNSGVSLLSIQFTIAMISLTAIGLWMWRTAHPTLIGLSFTVGLYILTIGMPIGYTHRYSQRYISNDIVETELAFLKGIPKDEKILWISSAPYPAFLLKVNTASPVTVGAQPGILDKHLKEANYDAIYFSRRMTKTGTNEYKCLEEVDNLDPDVFHMELVKDFRMNLDKRLQINRLTGVTLKAEKPVITPSEITD